MAYSVTPSKTWDANPMTYKQFGKYCSIRGFDQLIKNLNAEILAIEGGSRKGLILVAKFIQRDCEGKEPTTPIDLGNLRSSWQTHFINEGFAGSRRYGLRMGYSANYAMWVHEMVDADFKTKKVRYGPGAGRKRITHSIVSNTGAQWLKKSIDRNHDGILSIIAANTAVK